MDAALRARGGVVAVNLRELENESIRSFVQRAADEGYLSGRVLDLGCGAGPYRDIVEAVGEYHSHDDPAYPGHVAGHEPYNANLNWRYQNWSAILCNQVLQYVPIERDTDGGEGLQGLISNMHWCLEEYEKGDPPRGHLVLTYPTNWPEVEPEDLHRFTKAGMERLLTEAGFEIVLHERRAQIAVMIDPSAVLALGYSVVARA